MPILAKGLSCRILQKNFASIYKLDKKDIDEIYAQEHFFKLLRGDVLCHYPFGKNFFCEDVAKESERFEQKDISVTGLLLGERAMKARFCPMLRR